MSALNLRSYELQTTSCGIGFVLCILENSNEPCILIVLNTFLDKAFSIDSNFKKNILKGCSNTYKIFKQSKHLKYVTPSLSKSRLLKYIYIYIACRWGVDSCMQESARRLAKCVMYHN